MEALILKRDSNFKDIEAAFKIVTENPGLRLRLPNSLRDQGVFGLEGLVCQLLATWLRGNKDESVFHTYAAGVTSDAFDDINNSFYGICGLRLSDVIRTAEGESVSPSVALEHAYRRVTNVINGKYKESFKGLYVAIPSIKGSGDNKEFNCPFYNQKNIIGKEGFKKITSEILSVVVPQKSKRDLIDSFSDNVSEIIRELFDNTHKHARVNEKGDIFPTNFRGVIFNSSDVSVASLKNMVRTQTPGMLGFVSDWLGWMEDNDRNLPVLDITVVDSGPGYARRWTGKSKEELSFPQEVDAIIKCFEKNKTSSPNSADGSGLTHVLTDLKRLHGWFRLRTGSASVSRSYFAGLGSVVIEESDVIRAESFVDGVSFNLVIPLVMDIQGGHKNV